MAIVIEARGEEFTFEDGTSEQDIAVSLDEYFASKQPANEEPVVEETAEEPSMLDKVVGGIEAAGTIASSAITEPVAGVAGIVGSLLPGEEGQGAEFVEKTREALTFQPRTEEGKESIAAVGEVLKPVGDAFTAAEDFAGGAGFELGEMLGH